MGYTRLTLNTNNFIAFNSNVGPSSQLTIEDISAINASAGVVQINNNNNPTILQHTFEGPQILSKITIDVEPSSNGVTTAIVLLSTDGVNYSSQETISNLGDGNNDIFITQPTINPIKYKSFRILFNNFDNTTLFLINEVGAFIPDNLNEYSYKDYSVEFDDSLLDMASWKNSRYEGSKLTGTRINYYTEGDPIYPTSKGLPNGLQPIIENKICALFIGNNIQEGEASSSLDPLVEIKNHSYVTINEILLIDLGTLESTKISFEQFNETEEKKESFRRLISDNFPEGSKIVTKTLDIAVPTQLKESHRVKFNQGLLMKLYNYTPDTSGDDDGVFGGFGVRDQKGTLTDNIASGSIAVRPQIGGGMFGFGMTVPDTASRFNDSTLTTVEEFPSELSLYGNSIGIINSLNPSTASVSPTTDLGVYTHPNKIVI